MQIRVLRHILIFDITRSLCHGLNLTRSVLLVHDNKCLFITAGKGAYLG